MKFDAAAAREFANSLGYLDGAGPEVRLWLHNAIDAVDAAHKDAERIEWLNGAIFMPKWNGVLGSGSEVNWTIAGDWRHTCARMTGNDFRAAIDAAMASGKSAS